jgi:hypothetical protein
MMGSRGTSPGTEHQQAIAVLSEIMKAIEPLLSQPELAERLVELAEREANLTVRETKLRDRERQIARAVAALSAETL